MLSYPHIDPVLLALGPVKIHWYGVMYLLGFGFAYFWAMRTVRRGHAPLEARHIEDLVLYGAFGVILGGRLGYVLFYGWTQFVQNPLWLVRIWDGGMSFHGGLLGVMVAMALFARKQRCDFVRLMDFVVTLVPVGLGLGRLGNFINQELWGRPTDLPWAMVFPADPFQLPRHPSQLYQCALEGVVLFVLLAWFTRQPRPRYAPSALFLLGYGIFRFVVEFVREPDAQLGFVMMDWMTRGQQLSLPMVAAGAGLLWLAYRNDDRNNRDRSQA